LNAALILESWRARNEELSGRLFGVLTCQNQPPFSPTKRLLPNAVTSDASHFTLHERAGGHISQKIPLQYLVTIAWRGNSRWAEVWRSMRRW
jgi:hypothetical protein